MELISKYYWKYKQLFNKIWILSQNTTLFFPKPFSWKATENMDMKVVCRKADELTLQHDNQKEEEVEGGDEHPIWLNSP